MTNLLPPAFDFIARLQPRWRVGRHHLEVDDRFSRPGITQPLPRQPFDRAGIVSQRIDGASELFARFSLFLDLVIQAHDLFPEPLICLDQGKVPNGYAQETCDEQEENHHLRQSVPDAEDHVHFRE